jgi:predicted ATPase/transcriptional regulator with XRE-family HTH domain
MTRTSADSAAEPFGSALRRLRLAAGLSQEQLAERARISIEAVSALERGVRKVPQRQTLELLLEALELDAPGRTALTLAAVRAPQPRLRTPRADQPAVSWLLATGAGLTSFVGRDADLAALSALVQTARLTSIVGAGGIGKSRLALEAARVLARSPHLRVAVVALAPLLPTDPVLPILAVGLAIRDDGAVPLAERIVAAIGKQAMLLVLDNCEHVLGELAPVVGELLSRCAGLRILATSRERFRIDGERVYRLKPLAIGPAVELFIDRTQAGGFNPANSVDDMSLAAEICDRLDRMPLAIELAASCSDILAFEAILARLREGALLPATPKRSALPQHRSMQALVEWSYDRLDANEAVVFRRLVPFAGGCRLDDAQAMLADAALSKDDVLYSLFRLHERSLIDADRATLPRFQMLQTFRDFASMKLGPSERAPLEARFAKHYLGLTAAQDGELRSARQAAAIERIAADEANIRVALFALTANSAASQTGLAALGALAHYWLRTGKLTEGAQIFDGIDFSRFDDSAGLASALCGAAFIELNRNGFERAEAYAARATVIAVAIGDPWFEIYARIAQQISASVLGPGRVVEPFEPWYRRAVELRDPWLTSSAGLCTAALTAPAETAARGRLLDDALMNAEASGDAFAVEAIRFGLARNTTSDDPQRALGFVAAIWNGLTPAQVDRKAHCVECLAEIAIVIGRAADAALLFGIARALLGRSGASVTSRPRLNQSVRALAPAFSAALACGEAAPEAQADAHVAGLIQRFFKHW